MKKILIILMVLILIILALGIYKFNFTNDDIYIEGIKQTNIHDGTYKISGQDITLINGISEIQAAPDSSSKIITKYFGNDVRGDFDKDGREDMAFLITQNTGGSGTFFYLTALLNKVNGYVGTEAIFIGDRISPQTTEITKDNQIIVNYSDRKPGESFTVNTSIGKSLYLKLDTKNLQWGEVVQNFEGEANTSTMNLYMKTWIWVNAIYNDGKIIKPIKENKFTLTLKKDKTFSATTDCNNVGGEYSVNGNKIIFSKMISTMMYCEGSQETDFIKMLNETQEYLFTSKGELVLTMKFDSGSIFFR